MQKRNEPYVGPRPFEKEEHKVFFGRDMEADELTSLIAAHPVVLLYAQSGAGKTSLVKAGLIPKLVNEEEFDVLPPARVREQGTATVALKEVKNIFMFNVLVGLIQDEIAQDKRDGKEPLPAIEQAELAQMSLADYLKRRKEFVCEKQQHLSEESVMSTPTVVIFDQFEELFTFYSESWAQRKGFFQQLDEALDADPLLRVVFSMREDFIAEMDPYAPLLPEKLRTRFRMERLRERNALEAVKKPLVASELNTEGRSFAPGVAEQLVLNLLMRRVRVSPHETEEIKGEYVEPLQLQVVCQNLWQKLKPADRQITSEHLRAFGDVNQALSQFYEACVKEAAAFANIPEALIRGWVDRVLITPENTRATVLQSATHTGGLPNPAVEVLERKHLLRVEMRDNLKWYELSHDRFIPPIQESYKKWLLNQTGYEQLKQTLEEKAAIWDQGDKKNPALLLSRAELPEAVRWIESPEAAGIGYSPTLSAYVNASRAAISEEDNKRQEALAIEQQRRARQFRRGLVFSTVLLIFLAGMTVWAYQNGREAIKQKNYAEELRKIADAQTEASNLQRVYAERERLNAVAASENAMAASEIAKKERKLAVDAQAAALVEQKKAEEAVRLMEVEKERTETAKREALIAKASAEEQRKMAEEERGKALLAKEEAEKQKIRADKARGEALSRELAANSREMMSEDPEQSIALAYTATEEAETKQADNALRRALLQATLPRGVMRDKGLAVSAFSPDGKFAVTATEKGTARIWNMEDCNTTNCSSTEVGDAASRAAINGIAFSPNSELFITGDEYGVVQVWNVKTRTRVAKLEGHKGPISTLMFSRTGKYIATGSEDTTARLWNVEACRSAATCTFVELKGHDALISALAFNADDTVVATEANDRTGKVWKAETGAVIKSFAGLSGLKPAIALSPDGSLLAAEAGKDENGRCIVSVWTINTSSEPTYLTSHLDDITAVAFNNTGQYILTASADKTARVWKRYPKEIPGQAPLFIESALLRGHDDGLTSAQFAQSNSGLIVLTASHDKTARVWNGITGRSMFILRGHKGGVLNAVFSKNFQHILTTGADSTAMIWDSRFTQNMADRSVADLIGHQSAVTSAVFSPDGNLILTASEDRTARLYYSKSGQFASSFVNRCEKYRTKYRKAVFNANGNMVAVVGEDGKVRIWKVAYDVYGKLKPPAVVGSIGEEKGASRILDVAFNPTNDRVVTATANKTVEIWELSDPGKPTGPCRQFVPASWKRIAVLEGHGGSVNSVSFNSDGKSLVTSSSDGTARVWKMTGGTWKSVAELTGHGGGVNSAAFCHDNDKMIVTACEDNLVRVWRETPEGTWREAAKLQGHEGTVLSAVFNRDGSYIISVSEDRTAKVWALTDGERWILAASLMESTDKVLGASFSPDGKYVITASADGKARIYSELMFEPLSKVKAIAEKRGIRRLTDEELEKVRKLLPGNR